MPASLLSVSYFAKAATGTRVQPSGGNGENTIQPGGVMNQEWRNFFNGNGNYFTFTISGLAASTPFDLYYMGGANATGQNVGIALSAGNVYGSNVASNDTVNVANSNGAFGSLWTVSGGTTNLMAEGTTWEVLHGESDSSGNFSFLFETVSGHNADAYLAGFQLVAAPEPSTLTLAGIGMCGLIWRFRRSRN